MNPDFENLIKSYDLLIFVESKLNKLDDLNLPDEYSFYSKCRKKYKRKSGGITIIYKKSLSKFITFLNSNSEFIQWVEISKELFYVEGKNQLPLSDILLGCVYIPPEYSKYSSEEAFIEIENEMILFSKNRTNIAIVGDFNSRSGNLCDIVDIDSEFFDILNITDVASFVNET